MRRPVACDPNATGEAGPTDNAGPPEPGATETALQQQELRRRWREARQIVREIVGRQDEHDPRIWEHGLYLLWLWLAVEYVVVRRDDMDSAELAALSKMIFDQRKLSLEQAKQLRKAAGPEGGDTADTTKLPEHFGELVRQIYGTNFQDDAAPGESATPAPGGQTDAGVIPVAG
ncbi:MAG TPA: hypothetical protein VM243_03595 [Phycisphaerae bacterium]|nr:hypothetical protein [Phycisphaerae bacterium]